MKEKEAPTVTWLRVGPREKVESIEDYRVKHPVKARLYHGLFMFIYLLPILVHICATAIVGVTAFWLLGGHIVHPVLRVTVSIVPAALWFFFCEASVLFGVEAQHRLSTALYRRNSKK